MAIRNDLIQSRSAYIGSSPSVSPSVGNLVVDTLINVGSGVEQTQIGGGYLSFYNSAASAKYIKLIDDSSTINAIGFSKSGSSATTWFPSGNVGIGTTSPVSKLHVAGNGAFTGISVTNPDTSGSFNRSSIDVASNQITIGITAWGQGSVRAGTAWFQTVNNYPLVLGVNDAEVMRLTTSGNVGIGTSSPGGKLTVIGTISQNSSLQSGNPWANLILDSAASSNADTNFVYARSGTMMWDLYNDSFDDSFNINTKKTGGAGIVASFKQNGNVGIGTTNPISTLHVAGTFRSVLNSGAGGQTLFSAINGVSNGYLINVDTSNNITHTWHTGANNPSLFISSSGNIGIGTTSPTTKLHVDGVLRVDGGTDPNAANAAYLWNQGGLGPTISGFKFAVNTGGTGSQSQRFIVNENGNVGINTSNPQGKLHVVSGAGLYNATILNQSDLGGSVIIAADNSGTYSRASLILRGSDSIGGGLSVAREDPGATWRTYMAFYTNNVTGVNTMDIQEKMRLTSDGNLGIGTTSPAQKLQVNGAIWARPTSDGTSGTAIYMGRFVDSDTPAYSFITDDFSDDILSLYSSRWGVNYQINRASSTGDKNVWRIAGSDSGHTASLYDGSNNIKFYFNTAGSSYLNGGNIGIGTTNPQTKLHVVGVGRFDSNIQVFGDWSTTYPVVQLLDTKSGGATWNIENGRNSNNLEFYSSGGAGTVFSVQHSSGNVGIGTSNPTARLSLGSASQGNRITWENYSNIFSEYSSGDIWLSSNFYGNLGSSGYVTSSTASWGAAGIAVSGTGGGLNGVIKFFVDDAAAKTAGAAFVPSERMRITGSGNVGIGTTSPSQKLHIYGSGNQLLFIENSSTYHMYVGLSSNIGFVGSSNATPLSLQTNGNSRLYIDTSGNVGIGTTSPSQPLTVQALSNADTILLAGRSSDNASRIDFYNNAQNSRLYTIGLGNSAVEHFGQANIPMIFSTNSIERMRIASNGDVGIGTTNPTNKLSVAGTMESLATSSIEGGQVTLRAGSSYNYRWNIDNYADSFRIFREDDPNSANGYVAFFMDQVGTVGLNTTSPARSAILDLTATNRGFLPPRMTNTQMNNIASPAEGLIVYDTTNRKVTVYNGSSWVPLH